MQEWCAGCWLMPCCSWWLFYGHLFRFSIGVLNKCLCPGGSMAVSRLKIMWICVMKYPKPPKRSYLRCCNTCPSPQKRTWNHTSINTKNMEGLLKRPWAMGNNSTFSNMSNQKSYGKVSGQMQKDSWTVVQKEIERYFYDEAAVLSGSSSLGDWFVG